MQKISKYTRINKIGQGAYGSVYKAINTQTKELVAIKISQFQDQGVPTTCIRELAILKSISHPNLVRLIDAQIYRGTQPRVQMAFELLECDLSKHMKISGYKGESEAHFKRIIKSIINGVYYLHQKGIMHRDLKPHNILVSKQGDKVKIADMGLGRIICHHCETMSNEIETLWYRAPQLLLGSNKYDVSIDTWSIGCIFYEIVEGKVMFSADCEIGQLYEIFRILGTPIKSEWPEITCYPNFKANFPKFKPTAPEFRKMSFQGQQFLWRMIKVNPKLRSNIWELLGDQYLKQ